MHTTWTNKTICSLYIWLWWWFDDGLIWSMVWILLLGFYFLSLKGDRLSCCRHFFLSIVYYWILFSVFASYLFELVLDFQKRKVVVSFFTCFRIQFVKLENKNFSKIQKKNQFDVTHEEREFSFSIIITTIKVFFWLEKSVFLHKKRKKF